MLSILIPQVLALNVSFSEIISYIKIKNWLSLPVFYVYRIARAKNPIMYANFRKKIFFGPLYLLVSFQCFTYLKQFRKIMNKTIHAS